MMVCVGFQRVACGVFAAAMLVALVGCGGSKPKLGPSVEGKLTKGGQPLVVPDTMYSMIEMRFIRVDAPEGKVVDSPKAVVAKDGTYRLTGGDDRGIEPGKYKITVEQWEEYPNKDLLKGAFNLEKSPIVRDISGDGVIKLDIELDKPKG